MDESLKELIVSIEHLCQRIDVLISLAEEISKRFGNLTAYGEDPGGE